MEDKSACEEIIQILTGRHLKVLETRSQYSIRHLETHSVILDVLAESLTGEIVNLEMQTTENENHLKRSRYYQSCIDVTLLEKGKSYDALPNLYIIFITNVDFLKLGRGIYHIDRTIREDGVAINNGIYEIYINLQGEVKNDIVRALLDYIRDTDPNYQNDNFPHLIKRVKFYKEKEEGLDIMCDIIDAFVKEGKEAGMALGIAQGIEEGRAIGIQQGMAEGIEQGIAKGIEQGITKGIEQGMAKGIEQGMAKGIEQGIAEGTKQGQTKINRLIQLLAAQNRIADIIKSAEDPAYQTKLLKELNL